MIDINALDWFLESFYGNIEEGPDPDVHCYETLEPESSPEPQMDTIYTAENSPKCSQFKSARKVLKLAERKISSEEKPPPPEPTLIIHKAQAEHEREHKESLHGPTILIHKYKKTRMTETQKEWHKKYYEEIVPCMLCGEKMKRGLIYRHYKVAHHTTATDLHKKNVI